MEKRVSIRRKRLEAPEWVFTWHHPGRPKLAYWVALLVTCGLFVLLLATVRIRISTPVRWAAPKAAVIYVGDDELGRALTQRAREGGPFPSRFLPSEWAESAALERALHEAARGAPTRHVPALRDLPDESAPPLKLAARGVAALPRPQPIEPAAPMPAKLALVPVLYPLSGIRAADLPTALPPVEGAVDAAASAEPWRFLIRLDARGTVRDCVSLAGGDESGPPPVETWLRRVTFSPEPGTPSRWIAVGVGFANQATSDGTDVR